MAKQKRKPVAVVESRQGIKPADTPAAKTTSWMRTPDGRMGIRGYILLNLIFDVFCVLQLLFIRATLHETRGLYFFFGLLMVGFLVVSIYDYAYDRLVPDEEPV